MARPVKATQWYEGSDGRMWHVEVGSKAEARLVMEGAETIADAAGPAMPEPEKKPEPKEEKKDKPKDKKPEPEKKPESGKDKEK